MTGHSHVVVATAPGKLILAGEHAVVHHTKAIATVIELRTRVQLKQSTDDNLRLTFVHKQTQYVYTFEMKEVKQIAQPVFDEHDKTAVAAAADHSIEPPRALIDSLRHTLQPLIESMQLHGSPFNQSLIVPLLYHLLIHHSKSGVECEISSDLPLAAGLGSSASFCASLATAFYGLNMLRLSHQSSSSSIKSGRVSLDEWALTSINQWAFEGERCIHGNPSGVDNTCIVHGGVIVYQRTLDSVVHIKRARKLPSNTRILITNTRQPRDTKKLVEGVRLLKVQFPSIIDPVITSIDHIAQKWIDIIEADHQSISLPMNEVSQLIRINQSLLAAIGVSHQTINDVIAIGDRYDLSSKLTGAGGGGCVISMPNSDVGSLDTVKAELTKANFECFEAACGQGGVELIVE